MHNIDVIDKKILRLMQIDALLSVADISEKVGVATASCWRRIGRMEKSGIIKSHISVSYTHLRAHETGRNLVCRLLLEKKKKKKKNKQKKKQKKKKKKQQHK